MNVRMSVRRIFLCIGFLLVPLVAACGPSDTESADYILRGGHVWTGVEGASAAEAVAVRDARIAAVGTTEEVEELRGPETRVVEVDGRMVMPGFIDTHVHFMRGGFQLSSVQLRDAATPEEFVRRIANFAESVEPGTWITGGNWDHELWGGELPRREWVDSVTPENPVFVSRLDGHMALANSSALEAGGVTAETSTPPGGEIVRDEESGEPAGVLKDAAMDLVAEDIPEPSEEELDRALDSAAHHAVRHGVTQVHDMSSGSWRGFETYRRAREEGRLPLRIYSVVPMSSWERMRDYVAENGRGGDRLWWGGLKAYVDGSLGSTTAWFYEPYEDAPETTGLTVTDTATLRGWIRDADAADLHVVVHAIGTRANDWLLDVYEQVAAENDSRDRRFRIEHAQHLTREAIPRFAELGVIPSMQPYHAIDDGRWAENRIGPERIQTTYAFRSLLDAGATLALGSDWTVAPLDPLLGVYAAVTRRTTDGENPGGWVPEQKISLEETLAGYTRNAAYAGYREDVMGTLEPGKYADLVVLSENLFELDPRRIPEAQVDWTMVGGEVVFERE